MFGSAGCAYFISAQLICVYIFRNKGNFYLLFIYVKVVNE